MSAASFLHACVLFGLAVLCLSLLLTTLRVIKGPTLPDRVLAHDMLVTIAIGFIAMLGRESSFGYHVDIAIALGLVGFLATVAFARFVLTRGPDAVQHDENGHSKGATGERR